MTPSRRADPHKTFWIHSWQLYVKQETETEHRMCEEFFTNDSALFEYFQFIPPKQLGTENSQERPIDPSAASYVPGTVS
jgi:hypothetical protein